MEPTPPKRNTRQVMLAVNVETTKDVEAPEIDPALASPTGDLVLVVHRHSLPSDRSTVAVTGHHPEPETAFQYRVDSKRLQETSAYFARLLDPDKFGEGAAVAEHHVTLRSKYPTLDLVPFEELPTVHIADVGKISPTVKSIQNLMGDFLRALHDQDLSVKVPPLANVANLVVVADRFDALVAVRQYFKSRKLMALLDAKGSIAAKGQEKAINTWSEERVRQRLLVGLLLDNATWVWYSSSRLIHRGWVGKEADDNAALWWDLPMGIEGKDHNNQDNIQTRIIVPFANPITPIHRRTPLPPRQHPRNRPVPPNPLPRPLHEQRPPMQTRLRLVVRMRRLPTRPNDQILQTHPHALPLRHPNPDL